MTDLTAGTRVGPGPLRVALLSFLWPGLGHVPLRLPRIAALFAAPAVALALGALVVVLVRGPEAAALLLVAPAIALSVALGSVVTAAWRLLAVGDAVRRAGPPPGPPRVAAAGIAVVALAIVASHGLVGWYAWSLYDAGSSIFVAGPAPTAAPPGPTLKPGATPDPSASAIPSASAPPADARRFTVLLTGIDSSPTRTQSLTDTLIVASADLDTGEAVMVSFPRDLARFPMYDGGTFGNRINSLMNFAARRPERFPDGSLPAVARELGFLAGIDVPYYASVDLAGFVRMIDAVGGVTIDNPRTINDPGYGGWTDGRVGFSLAAGTHTLNGETALAFVRSRKGAGDNDFTRARRQQQLLVALGRKLSDPAMLPRLPDILRAAKDTIRTNVPPERLQELLDLGRTLADDRIRQVVLGPPYANRATDTSQYLLVLDEARLRAVSIDLFGSASRYANP